MNAGAALATLLLASAPAFAQQQVCETKSYPLSSPTARFIDNADGTVTDSASGLMWMRCSAGQSWSGNTCAGVPASHDWSSAQAWATEINGRGQYFFSDWRLPQLRELATLAERQCDNPRVNLSVFPATPPALYWSASSRRGDASGNAFALSFGADGVRYQDKQQPMHVRLVRHAR